MQALHSEVEVMTVDSALPIDKQSPANVESYLNFIFIDNMFFN